MKHKHSTRLVLPILFLLLATPMFHGCVLLLLGGGAAGGYAVSRDSVEGVVDGKKAKVYRASIDTIKNKGLVKSQSEGTGDIEALVQDVTVKVHVEQVTEKSTKLKVSARKYKMPRVKVAQDVYTDILKRVA